MSRQSTSVAIATIGIDLGKNTFHLIGLDQRWEHCFAVEDVAQSA